MRKIIFCFLFFVSSLIAQDTCTYTNNGQTWNLNPLSTQALTYRAVVGSKSFTYSVQYCKALVGIVGCTGAAACQQPYPLAGANGTSLGIPPPNYEALTGSKYPKGGIRQTYLNGKKCNATKTGRQAIVETLCHDTTVSSVTNVTEVTKCVYLYSVNSIYGCSSSVSPTNSPIPPPPTNSLVPPPPANPGGSTGMDNGWWFVIAIAILGVVYLVVGTSVQSIRGRRGFEMIPNLEFWKDFPFLIIDGFKFTFRKITCKSEYSAL
eukprot:TRINITY_DN18083_c0_g1_i1.p1 TRINITY_DN18083_c0_g1~~TRINITY_DN18083_c0_g1_i1.p1  ORF type:complete len:283 (+),score=38.76 TRINITY_DN18083_c0_g1_i1:60-851(+)